MAQFILDCFPDAISQYGLLGCAVPVLAIVLVVSLSVIVARHVHTRLG